MYRPILSIFWSIFQFNNKWEGNNNYIGSPSYNKECKFSIAHLAFNQ